MDVVPGHYNTMWFRPTKVGKYHFFCSQYCGTDHAVMGGWVTVMEPDEYAKWLAGAADRAIPWRQEKNFIPNWPATPATFPMARAAALV